jgi:hypothetical protein
MAVILVASRRRWRDATESHRELASRKRQADRDSQGVENRLVDLPQ